MPKRFAIRLSEIEVEVIRQALEAARTVTTPAEDAVIDGLLECLPAEEG